MYELNQGPLGVGVSNLWQGEVAGGQRNIG